MHEDYLINRTYDTQSISRTLNNLSVTQSIKVPSRNKESDLYYSEHLFNTWRLCEIVSAGFANLSLAFATIDYELYYSDGRTHTNCAIKSSEDTFRYLIVICSFITLFFLLIRHRIKYTWKEYLLGIESNSAHNMSFIKKDLKNYRKKSRFIKPSFIFEILLIAIQPYPGMHLHVSFPFKYQDTWTWTCYNLAELCYCVMFFRLILMLRAIGNYTPYENYVARRYCHRYNVTSNMRFSFKCMMKMFPLPIVVFIIGIPCMIVLGCMVRVFERPLIDLTNKEWDDPLNGIWFMFATMSTIGYGDYVPITYFGRTVSVIGYMVGGLLFTLVMVSVQTEISLSQNQAKAFKTVLVTDKAAQCIQAAIKYNSYKKKFGPDHPKSKRRFFKLDKKINSFKLNKEEVDDIYIRGDKEIINLKNSVKDLKEELSGLYKKVHLLSTLAVTKFQANNKKYNNQP